MAATEPGEKRFAEAQRKPADPPAETKTSFKTETEAATKEAHERWTINGIANVRAWAPAPPAPEIVPAPIVVWSKAPGPIVNPSPPPSAHPPPLPLPLTTPT